MGLIVRGKEMSSSDVSIHKRHEQLTDTIYESSGMLPSRYVYILTNLCNFSCPFCFQYRKKTKDPMTKEDWLKVTSQIPDYARVTLTGGEPLVYKGFTEILEGITENNDCNIITNGALLTEQWVDILLQHPRLKVISISIDDVGNKSRQLKPGMWENIVRNISKFREKRTRAGAETILDIKTIVLDENAEELFNIYKYCVEELRCDTHAFQFLKGSHLQHADTMYEFDEIYKIPEPSVYKNLEIIYRQLEKVREYATKNNQRSYLHPIVGKMQSSSSLPDINYLNEVEFNQSNYQACKFPWSSVHINADGHLFPCMAISMGNVKEQSLESIIQGETFKKFRKVIKEQGTVSGCHRCGWLRPNEKLLTQ